MIIFEIIDTAAGILRHGSDAMAYFWSGISNLLTALLHASSFVQEIVNAVQLFTDWIFVF
jgi:hypothetical protein